MNVSGPLGRTDTGDLSAPFSMAVLAIKTATFCQRGEPTPCQVSREMFWQPVGGNCPFSEVPIHAITNGVHGRSCVAKSTQELYDRYLGPKWSQARPEASLWERVYAIPDEELWRNHELCRSQLVMAVRERLTHSLMERGASAHELMEASGGAGPLCIDHWLCPPVCDLQRGRATLFLHDVERIRNLIQGNGDGRRIQFVIAGKAHPKDIPGKELIRKIIHFTRDQGLSRSIVFVAQLRHPCLTGHGGGLRYLAEQPPSPQGSFWHQRHESGHEWIA